MEEFGKNFTPNAHKSLVSKWEKGQSQPSAERLKKIAELGNTSVDLLINGDFFNQLTDIADEVSYKTLVNNVIDPTKQNKANLKSAAAWYIFSVYKRGRNNFDEISFERILSNYMQLELDLGDRDIEALTQFAFSRTIEAQELVVEYYEDEKAKKYLENEDVQVFLNDVSEQYEEILNYINDFRLNRGMDDLKE